MALLKTPVCNFGEPIVDFSLPATDGKTYQLVDCQGKKGTLVMFICNHCPYVKAIQARLVEDIKQLVFYEVKAVAMMSNDVEDYPEDSFENMRQISQRYQYPFPYFLDKTQAVAKAYDAKCTPDFFGYNQAGELQYRGRLDAYHGKPAPSTARRELLDAMVMIAKTGYGPKEQHLSMGCSIKWKNDIK